MRRSPTASPCIRYFVNQEQFEADFFKEFE